MVKVRIADIGTHIDGYLCKQAGISYKSKDLNEWLKLIEYFKNKIHTYRPATWRQYRSALRFLIITLNLSTEIREVLENLSVEDTNKEKATGKTTSNKQKSINSKQAKRLIEGWEKSNNFYAEATSLMFKSTLLLGLRPCEFENMFIVARGPDKNFHEYEKFFDHPVDKIVVVDNAKSTHDRSHGPKRLLDITHFKTEEVRIIWHTVQHFNKHKSSCWTLSSGQKANSYEEYYSHIRDCFRQNYKAVFSGNKKRIITMYSARHQFIADLKASGYSLKEIAALSGHATDKTASLHYGKRRSGKKGFSLPQSSFIEVNRVRLRYTPMPRISAKPSPTIGL